MAKSDRELKPLLDKSTSHHHQQQQQQGQQQQHSTTQKKHTMKGKTSSKPKLFSVSETSVESIEPSMKEERRGQCSEKDVDETESQKINKKKPTTQATLSPHPHPPPQHLQTSPGGGELDEGKQAAQNFGVKSYLHHFYESVSQTPSQEENYQYLMHPKGTRCGAIWFKIGLIMGATLFLLGPVAIFIGYAIDRKSVV